MSRVRNPRLLLPLALLAFAAVAALLGDGRLMGQAAGPVTWSGRIRIERTMTMKTHCTNCEQEVHDFTSSENYATEYQVESIGKSGPAEWSSDDVRVTVQGRQQSHSYGVNPSGNASVRMTSLEIQMEGSGSTNASVNIFLRQSGEADAGHCRLEFSPIGDRPDNGPLSGVITLRGTEHLRFVPKQDPPYDGTKETSTTIGPESDMLDMPCPIGAKRLNGSRVVQNDHGVFKQITWDLSQDGEAQTEVVLIPAKDYDQWLPQAGDNESAIGDFIDVRIVARERGKPGSKPPQDVKKFKLQLADVSREFGVCLNWPPSASAKAGPDLKFDPDNPYIKLLDKDAQSAETKEEGLTEFMVTVNSHDWGAFGKLQVTAELEDGSTVQGHVENRDSAYALALPKDDNSNHVADWWEHWFDLKNTAPEADDETMPAGDGHDGDSISLYEEYRGFRMRGKHERLSPELKDLFVDDRHHLGLGYFGRSGLQTHTVDPAEITYVPGGGNNSVVSGNHGKHKLGNVWAIKLVKESIGEGAAGETLGGPGVPSKIQAVRIDTVRIAAAAGPYAAAELKSTIAHELGHAVNIWHHGDGLDYSIAGDVLCRRKDGTSRNFICASRDCFGAAVQHGAFSGDDQCIMRYDSTDFYESAAGNCEWRLGPRLVRGKRYGYDPPGTLFCETGKGTGVNDTSKLPNKAGDASVGRGTCTYKFCVNSNRH